MTAVVDRPTVQASPPARGAAWLAIAAVALGVALAPPGGGTTAFQGVAEVVDGEIEALRSGSWTALTGGADVHRDEPLRTLEGSARLRVRGGQLWLAPGTRVTLDRDTTALRDGAVLFDGDAVRAVDFGAVAVRGRGAFRVDASPAARVGVYRGGAAVSDGTRERVVRAYEQVDLTEGRAGDPVALRYVPEDPWDARLLGAALAIDHQIERTAASLRAVYGTQLQAPEFYRDFFAVDDVLAEALPRLSPISRDGAFGPPAEALVAVMVTRLLVQRAGLSVAEAAADIAVHRGEGATWGLVLRRHDLRADDLRAAADTALRSRAIAVAEGSAAPVEDDAGPSVETPGEDPGGTSPPSDAPDDDTPPDDEGDDGDDEGDDGDDDEEEEEDPTEPVEDVIDELPLPPAPPGLERAIERADEAAQDVLDRLSRREDPLGRREWDAGRDG